MSKRDAASSPRYAGAPRPETVGASSRPYGAVLFDLDGVIVSTDRYHFRAWSALAAELGIPFRWEDNEGLRGVSRMESLSALLALDPRGRSFSREQREAFARRKNERYVALLGELTGSDVLPGVRETMAALRARGVRMAVASSSRNARRILDGIGMLGAFDAIADGGDISRSKPDPEVFEVAARRVGVRAADCLVVEDAVAGIEAAVRAGMDAAYVGRGRCELATAHLEGIEGILGMARMPGA